jgi:arabinan endo-1,5-alpha-L-arabinosidase
MPTDPAPAPPGLPADWEAVEAPFIVRHDHYYYLFTSWDLCCRGLKSTYKTMVGRSKSVTGPYFDESGRPLSEGGGTELLVANSRWLGPGGGSIVLDPENLIVFHAYDAKTGKPSMQLSTIVWTGGWPHVAIE